MTVDQGSLQELKQKAIKIALRLGKSSSCRIGRWDLNDWIETRQTWSCSRGGLVIDYTQVTDVRPPPLIKGWRIGERTKEQEDHVEVLYREELVFDSAEDSGMFEPGPWERKLRNLYKSLRRA